MLGTASRNWARRSQGHSYRKRRATSKVAPVNRLKLQRTMQFVLLQKPTREKIAAPKLDSNPRLHFETIPIRYGELDADL